MYRHFQIRKYFVRIYDPFGGEKRQPGANIYLSFLENVSILLLLYIVKLFVKSSEIYMKLNLVVQFLATIYCLIFATAQFFFEKSLKYNFIFD